jgi:hypothetical protein
MKYVLADVPLRDKCGVSQNILILKSTRARWCLEFFFFFRMNCVPLFGLVGGPSHIGG